jgi:SNF family Na+-dependent transporter
MPVIFGKIPLGSLFSGLWFLLLFVAGITSSVSLIQPAITFFEDEFGYKRQKATLVLGALAFFACLPAIFFLGHGFVDELDFWGGTFFLVVFATIEVFVFSWILGIDRGFSELHKGALIKVPRVFRFILKYVTPVYLLILLGVWSYQQLIPVLFMSNYNKADHPYIWGARALIIALWIALAFSVYYIFRNKRVKEGAR